MLVFISYSRKEFYFAESLARDLKARDIPIWFDAFDISSGTDWETQIGTAVGASTICLLIASKSSLTSQYSQKEWRGALDAGRPVVIVAFEAIDLPVELNGQPTFDFRSKYEDKFNELVTCLLQGKGGRDMVPKPNRFGLPTALPPTVFLTAGALFLSAFISALFVAFFFVGVVQNPPAGAVKGLLAELMRQHPTVWGCEVLCIWYGVSLGNTCLRFIRRVSGDTVRAWFFYQIPILLWIMGKMLAGIQDEWTHGDVRQSILQIHPGTLGRWGASWLLYATLAVWALDWIVAFKIRSWPDLLRWQQIGPVWERVRAYCYEADKEAAPRPELGTPIAGGPAAPTGEAGSATVSRWIEVLAIQEESSVARAIEAAMTNAGHRLSVAGQTAHISIIVLTNRTRIDWLDQVLAATKRSGRVICVVATSIDIPDDRSFVVGRQWVDYRKRRPETLYQLGQALGRSNEVSRPLSVPPAPEALGRPVYPTGVRLAWAAIVLVVGQAIGVAMATWSIPPEQIAPATERSWVLAMGALVAVLGLWLWHALLTRTAGRRVFAIAGVFAVLASSSQLILFSPTITVMVKMVRFTGLSAAQLLLQVVSPILWFATLLHACCSWLPDAGTRVFLTNVKATIALRNHSVFKWYSIGLVLSGLISGWVSVRYTADFAPHVVQLENRQRVDKYLEKFAAEIARRPRLQELLRSIDSSTTLDFSPDILNRLQRDLGRRQLAIAILQAGWLTVPDEVLDQHARLSLKLLERMDNATCAAVARGQMESIASRGESLGKMLMALERVDKNAIDEFINIRVEVLWAGVSGTPPPVIEANRVDAALDEIVRGLKSEEATRYKSILRAGLGVVGDEDACWFDRTYFKRCGALRPTIALLCSECQQYLRSLCKGWQPGQGDVL
jgi:hypothetical protein